MVYNNYLLTQKCAAGTINSRKLTRAYTGAIGFKGSKNSGRIQALSGLKDFNCPNLGLMDWLYSRMIIFTKYAVLSLIFEARNSHVMFYNITSWSYVNLDIPLYALIMEVLTSKWLHHYLASAQALVHQWAAQIIGYATVWVARSNNSVVSRILHYVTRRIFHRFFRLVTRLLLLVSVCNNAHVTYHMHHTATSCACDGWYQ